MIHINDALLTCSDAKPHFGAVRAPGILKTTISLDHFKGLDYNEVMRTFGCRLFGDMLFTEEGLQKIAKDPRVLSSFFILTFAVNYRFDNQFDKDLRMLQTSYLLSYRT